MIKFRNEFELNCHAQNNSDLWSFWLRKTKKPVLAILMVQKQGGRPKFYRGTNMEVCGRKCIATAMNAATSKVVLL
jgi:hypothetical protein